MNLRIKIDKTDFKTNQPNNKYIGLIISIILLILLLCIFGIRLIYTKNNNINIDSDKYLNNNNIKNETFKQNNLMGNKSNSEIKEIINIKLKFNLEKYENEEKNNREDNQRCNDLDPINMFNQRLKDKSTTICQSGNSNHICYKNNNNIFVARNGAICTMENIIIDPSKWKYGGYIYKSPVDESDRGCPLLSKGFFNMKCDNNNKQEFNDYDPIYKYYFDGWNYEYNEKEEYIEELV